MAQLRFRGITRVVSRTLLVAGFAGAAWLLSSAAAHAAAPTQSTVAGPGTGAVSLTAPVTRTAVDLLGAVLSPQHTVAAPAVAQRRTSRAASPIPTVLNLLSPLTGAVARPATTSLTDLLVPVTGSLRIAPARALRPAATVTRTGVPVAAPLVAGPTVAAAVATRTPVRRPAASGHHAVRFGAPRPAADPGARQVPGLPDRTPTPAYPDSGNKGISTTASGSHLDGGAPAASTQVPGGPSADRRGLDVTEVPVRLLLAEAPIFAPD